MRIRPRLHRRAFTLMEVLLASAIGLIVLTGVYLAIDTQLKFAEEGRDLIEEATLARSLTARITSDLTPCVGQPDPGRYRSKTSTQTSTTTSTTTTSTTQSSTTPTTGMSGDMTGGETQEVVRAFLGFEKNLNVFVSRVPRAASNGTNNTMTANAGMAVVNQIESDQKLITYWLAGASGGGRPLGLARYEESLSTATADGLPAVVGGADEAKYVIAPEVVFLEFRYFDGISWGTDWDGREFGQDDANQNTPKGPPKAIRIDFHLKSKKDPDKRDKDKKFSHVIAIPTANGTAQTNSGEAAPQEP
jgi:prepilin-type N-terminal cleavage/methylation domain-containing protein